MNVKELKEQLKFAKDEDIVLVEAFEFGSAEYEKVDEVKVTTGNGEVVITAVTA